jgi:hypothetical protein
MLSFSIGVDTAMETITALPVRGRPKKIAPLKPIAPFEKNGRKAAALAFDRETGEAIPASSLRTYADALAQYHISPESKFLNGDFLHRGSTQRRHVHMAHVQHIGKEADDWERHIALGISANAAIAYADRFSIADSLSALVEKFGRAQTAKAMQVASRQLDALLCNSPVRYNDRYTQDFRVRMAKASKALQEIEATNEAESNKIRLIVQKLGLREAARKIGVDPSNLRRRLKV